MALTTYKVPLDWEFDPEYVNVPPDYEYLAWRLGVNYSDNTALWAIEAAVETPTVTIESLLPPDYVVVDLNTDTPTEGYTRDADPTEDIEDVETKFNNWKNIHLLE